MSRLTEESAWSSIYPSINKNTLLLLLNFFVQNCYLYKTLYLMNLYIIYILNIINTKCAYLCKCLLNG